MQLLGTRLFALVSCAVIFAPGLSGIAAADGDSTFAEEIVGAATMASLEVGDYAGSTALDTSLVEIPDNSDQFIEVVPSEGLAAESLVSLPEEYDLTRQESAAQGFAVYTDDDSDDAVAVSTPSDDSIQIEMIVAGYSSPHQFTFFLGESYYAEMQASGAIAVVKDEEISGFVDSFNDVCFFLS